MHKTLQGAKPDDQLVILENDPDLVMDKTYPANQRWEDSGVVHLHPHQDEEFEIVEGVLTVQAAGEERTYAAGENFTIPRGTPHLMCNQSNEPVRTRWIVRPAMNTETFFETTYWLSKEGKLDNLLQLAVVAWTYRDIFKPLSPPLWIQPLIFAPLALIGRLLGYKARVP